MSLVLPSSSRFVLRTATLPVAVAPGFDGPTKDGLCSADLVISDGRIEAVLPAGSAPGDLEGADLHNRMVWPCFADMHTHIDKGHIWDRQPNPTGDFDGALAAVRADREANWTAADVETRMDFSLRCAYAHGTSLLRTHIDSLAPQHRISFDVFTEMRARWQDRINLQAVALFPIDAIDDKAYFADLVEVVSTSGALLGGVTYPMPDLDKRLDILFRTAADKGLDIDLHVDETQDAGVLTLLEIAEAKLRNGFEGAVTVGHCCSLARQDDDTAKTTIEKVFEAGLSVVSLPMCNMYLQDRQAHRTPRFRGITLLHELAAAGVPVAVASDNTRDPFYAYGDLDMVEVFREAVRIAHLDHPLDHAAKVVTSLPADILKVPEAGRIAAGLGADLVIFHARSWSEFLSRPQADRIVMRNGMGIDRRLPDYSELDPLMRG
ncbi:cytosine deaminase [Roseibium sediminicola]|uniref:Cytosine deaminase n=1 Tax=Roseibium sediminicola TaxID=2933272 RepID=A0ABT0GWV4_9HYPH|nr:cytosine deaminase [Roseibium sp. CAU 1639]MCK7613926.1 cytosine deaminase [Roseibium sp. CAU 1639]